MTQNGAVLDAAPARRPTLIELAGRFVHLAPLSPDHADALFPLVDGPEREDLWRYLAQGPFDSVESFRHHVAQLAAAPDAVFLALLDPATRKPLGYASYMRIDVPNRVVEIGNILLSPPLQRTAAATEALYLMARHAFEDLRFRRFEWKCNARNMPSRRAAQRLGFTFEGIFRQHMIVKGQSRDTAWFAMLDHEWPLRRAAFEDWLAPRNFDEAGRQRRSLADLRSKAAARFVIDDDE